MNTLLPISPAAEPPTDTLGSQVPAAPGAVDQGDAARVGSTPRAGAGAPASVRTPNRPAPLASALDALGVMLLHVSLDGRVLAWSRAARERLGWDGGVRGERLDEALSASGAGPLARRIADEGPVSWEAAWGCADGSRVRVRVAAEIETHADGPRLLCVATPLSDTNPARA